MLANPPADPMLSHNHVSIAWVTDLLKDSDGKYVGFLMPEIANSKPLSSICNPRLRKRNAPGFNWYYLHVTALNTAWIIQAIHAKGYVLGDIKLENILVNDRAMTAVIDTDSFQVRDTSAKKIYLCTVGSEGFTPPELIGKDFHKVKQSQNQDRFRLGVLIHYLLFGYHPFSGSWTGVGECPEQTELIKHGYWYGRHNSPIRESKTTIILDVVHPKLKQLFLQCFNDGHEQSHLRPSAKDWHKVLETAVNDLTACNRIDNHHYSKHYGRCYWCDRADKLGVDIFPGAAGSAKITTTEQYYYEEYYDPKQSEQNVVSLSENTINSKSNLTSSNTKKFENVFQEIISSFLDGITTGIVTFVPGIFVGILAFVTVASLCMLFCLFLFIFILFLMEITDDYAILHKIVFGGGIFGAALGFIAVYVETYQKEIDKIFVKSKKGSSPIQIAVGASFSSSYFGIISFILLFAGFINTVFFAVLIFASALIGGFYIMHYQ